MDVESKKGILDMISQLISRDPDFRDSVMMLLMSNPQQIRDKSNDRSSPATDIGPSNMVDDIEVISDVEMSDAEHSISKATKNAPIAKRLRNASPMLKKLCACGRSEIVSAGGPLDRGNFRCNRCLTGR